MDKERYNQIVDEVYGKFITIAISFKEGYENGEILGSQQHIDNMFSNPDELIILTKKQFVEKCKTNKEFSEDWGLKIEERELSLKERTEILKDQSDNKEYFYDNEGNLIIESEWVLNKSNTPTKLITVTYNNETLLYYPESLVNL